MGSGAFLVQVCRWLSERLVEAWAQAEEGGKSITSDGEVVDAIGSREPLRKDTEERLLTARRLIAERCLYGVDMNPLAVELAKLSIWLVTLAKGRPFGFLDHNLRRGDSLLGITSLEQLHYLDINPGKGSAKKLFASKIDQAVKEAIDLRTTLRSRPIYDIRDVEAMVSLDEQARQTLELPELIADAFIGAILAANGNEIDSTALSIEAGRAMVGDQDKSGMLKQRAIQAYNTGIQPGKRQRRPFHWPLEYPEVFDREQPGFDAFVGNPPFLGGKKVSGAFGSLYQTYLVNYVTLDNPSSVDFVVHFFLRVHSLLRKGGYSGLLGRRSINEATNREVGLRQLLNRGMKIYLANTNMPWPGKAAVVVHQIHIVNSNWSGICLLNGVRVDTITEELSDTEVWDIQTLEDNTGRMFQGTILSGEGFKISAETAQSLLVSDEAYSSVVFPFVGGNEINKDYKCAPTCWVICFWDWSEERARRFEEAFEIVQASVQPERQLRKANGDYKYRDPLPQRWWHYGEKRPALYHAIGRGRVFEHHPENWNSDDRQRARVLAISTGTTKYPAFTFLPPNMMYSNKLCILADERYSVFAVLSSDIHSAWAWARKTTLQADMESLRYAHGNIFETFPFPNSMLQEGDPDLEQLGKRFFENRQSFMQEHNVGLTNFYN
jgi:hypothetical protein